MYTDEMVSLEHKVSYHNNHLLRKYIGIVDNNLSTSDTQSPSRLEVISLNKLCIVSV